MPGPCRFEVDAEGISALEHPYAKHNDELIQSASSRLAHTLKHLSPREAILLYEDAISQESRRIASLPAVFREGQLLLIPGRTVAFGRCPVV